MNSFNNTHILILLRFSIERLILKYDEFRYFTVAKPELTQVLDDLDEMLSTFQPETKINKEAFKNECKSFLA